MIRYDYKCIYWFSILQLSFKNMLLFKVFVANPNKAQPIQDILLKNKDRLVEFLTQFHTDRTGKPNSTVGTILR